MCWNENISLNTFIFSVAVLFFIFYNNCCTQYKIAEFADWKMYALFFSFVVMQLIEYFLWKSIRQKDSYKNMIFSVLGWIVIRIVQPLILILLIPDKYLSIKYLSFLIYFILLIVISIYKYFYNPLEFTTIIGKNNHLLWNWLYLNNLENILSFVYFILFIPFFMRMPLIATISFAFLTYCYINYKSTFTWGSMWCWISNSTLLYFLIQILFIMPYKEYKMLC
jgi:hypothetical protein